MLGPGFGDGGRNANETTPREGQDPKGQNWGYLYWWALPTSMSSFQNSLLKKKYQKVLVLFTKEDCTHLFWHQKLNKYLLNG